MATSSLRHTVGVKCCLSAADYLVGSLSRRVVVGLERPAGPTVTALTRAVRRL